MGDGDSIGGQIAQQLKEIPQEFGKQAKHTVTTLPKHAAHQITNTDPAQDEAQKMADHMRGQQRIAELNAEIAAIARQNAAKEGPEILQTTSSLKEPLQSPVERQVDIVSDRAKHKVERDKQNQG